MPPNWIQISLLLIAVSTRAECGWGENSLSSRGLPLSVTVDSAVLGAALEQPFVYIAGTVNAPPNSSVIVGGAPATLTTRGRFFANQVPIRVGMNTIPVTVRTEDGATTATQVLVRRTAGEMPFQLMVDEINGRIYASVATRIARNKRPVDIVIDFDMDGDGRVDFSTTDFQKAEATIEVAMGAMRTVIARVKKKEGSLLWSSRFSVYSEAPVDTYKVLTGVYGRLLERLKTRNVDAALNLIAEPTREPMRAQFIRAGSNLPALAQAFGTVKEGEVAGKFGSISVIRKEGGVERPYAIQFSRGSDGIWRIETL